MTTHTTSVSPARRVALAFVALTVALTAFLAFGATADAREKVDPQTRTETREHVLLSRGHVSPAPADSFELVLVKDDPQDAPDDYIFCPEGTYPSPFDMPVYDEDGLFVIGHVTVWFCIDNDLEPAG